MGWRLRLSDKTVRKLAELPIYCQRQKCSPGNVVSGSIRFMQTFAGVRWRGGVKWEWSRLKWRFSLHSVTVFRTFCIHGHMTAFRWYDCQWPWAYFKVIGLFHIKFLKNDVWYGESYYRLLIGNHTPAFVWCHFWWPWSMFEGHFSLGCYFHVHFSNPWHAFASHGLSAIAELLVWLLILGTWLQMHSAVCLSVGANNRKTDQFCLQCINSVLSHKLHDFYRAMHFSANARYWDRMSSVRPSVRLSVCDVSDLWSHKLEILKTKCTDN